MRLLLFSRGRGYGHAVPDVEIFGALTRLNPCVDVHFATYDAGAVALSNLGVKYYDLRLPEANRFLDTLAVSNALIDRVRPDIVVSHEEFAAVVAGKQNGIRTLFLSDWLPERASIQLEAVELADAIILMNDEGLFEVSPGLRSRVRYVGPIVTGQRKLRRERGAVRAQIGVAPNSYLVTVVPGGAASEDSYPLFGLIRSAFESLRIGEKDLLWLSARDAPLIGTLSRQVPSLHSMPFFAPLNELLSASDIVVTKGTRITAMECASVGTPSIALLNGRNPIDSLMVPRVPATIALNARAVTPEGLLGQIERIRSAERPNPVRFGDEIDVARAVANAAQITI